MKPRKVVTQDVGEFVRAVELALFGKQHDAVVLMGPSDAEDEFEHQLFLLLRAEFSGVASHLPQTRLDGECIVRGGRKLFFDRDHDPTADLLAAVQDDGRNNQAVCDRDLLEDAGHGSRLQAWTFEVVLE